MRLWLDDNRDPPEGWEVARTADEAKLHLMHGDVETMSLDHDLDAPPCNRCNFECGVHDPEKGDRCEHGCDCHDQSGGETGLDLLHWMRATGLWPKSKPTVHSANLVGSLRMRKFIGDYWPEE